MTRRTVEKLMKRPGGVLPYGRGRASGSRKGRRGRRAILARYPSLRDRSGAPLEERLRLAERDLERLETLR